MNLVSTEAVAQRIPMIMTGIQHGVPEPLAHWLSVVSASYLETILKLAGSTPTRVTVVRDSAEGERDGVRIGALAFRVGWA